MKKHNISFAVLEILAIIIAVLHFAFLVISSGTVDTQSLVLILLPYGLPIFIFASAYRYCKNDMSAWSKSGFLTMALFALTFIAMSAHVTLAYFYSSESFINIYFNIPVLYSPILFLFAILWAGTKTVYNTSGKKGIIGRFISVLPKLLIIAMIIHTVVVSVVEITRQLNGPLITSAPWWVSPLIIALCYLIAIAVSLIIRVIYNRIKSTKS